MPGTEDRERREGCQGRIGMSGGRREVIETSGKRIGKTEKKRESKGELSVAEGRA